MWGGIVRYGFVGDALVSLSFIMYIYVIYASDDRIGC